MDKSTDDELAARRRPLQFWGGTTKKLDLGLGVDAPEEAGEKFAELDLHRTVNEDEKVPASFGSIDFVLDKDNDQPARFATVSSDSDVVDVYRVLTEAWELQRPSVILSVTGAAQSLSLDGPLQTEFRQGLASAAQSTQSWIISGGTDTGVMARSPPLQQPAGWRAHGSRACCSAWQELTGSVMTMGGLTTPCIGIPAYHKVMYKEKLATQLVAGRGPRHPSRHRACAAQATRGTACCGLLVPSAGRGHRRLGP